MFIYINMIKYAYMIIRVYNIMYIYVCVCLCVFFVHILLYIFNYIYTHMHVFKMHVIHILLDVDM